MLDLTQLLPFLAAALALNLTPGADMTYVVARSATQGRAAGIAASLGIAAGSFVHSVLAALGVSALLQHSETAFLIVKYAGAAYLLYLAWKAIRTRNQAMAVGDCRLLGQRGRPRPRRLGSLWPLAQSDLGAGVPGAGGEIGALGTAGLNAAIAGSACRYCR